MFLKESVTRQLFDKKYFDSIGNEHEEKSHF